MSDTVRLDSEQVGDLVEMTAELIALPVEVLVTLCGKLPADSPWVPIIHRIIAGKKAVR